MMVMLPQTFYVDAYIGDKSFEDIAAFGTYHRKKTAYHEMMFSTAVEALHDKCEVVRGGSSFGAKANEYWGLNPDQASKYLKIGRNFHKIMKVYEYLPSAYTTIFRLAYLTDIELLNAVGDRELTPQTTGKQAKKLVEKAEKKRKEDEEYPSLVDEELFHEVINSLYAVLPDTTADQIQEFALAEIRPVSIELLDKCKSTILDQVGELRGAEQKKLIPILTNILFDMDTHRDEIIEENIYENFQKWESQLDKRENELDKREQELIDGNYRKPKHLLTPAEILGIRQQLSDRQLEIFNRAYPVVGENTRHFGDENQNPHAPPQPSRGVDGQYDD